MKTQTTFQQKENQPDINQLIKQTQQQLQQQIGTEITQLVKTKQFPENQCILNLERYYRDQYYTKQNININKKQDQSIQIILNNSIIIDIKQKYTIDNLLIVIFHLLHTYIGSQTITFIESQQQDTLTNFFKTYKPLNNIEQQNVLHNMYTTMHMKHQFITFDNYLDQNTQICYPLYNQINQYNKLNVVQSKSNLIEYTKNIVKQVVFNFHLNLQYLVCYYEIDEQKYEYGHDLTTVQPIHTQLLTIVVQILSQMKVEQSYVKILIQFVGLSEEQLKQFSALLLDAKHYMQNSINNISQQYQINQEFQNLLPLLEIQLNKLPAYIFDIIQVVNTLERNQILYNIKQSENYLQNIKFFEKTLSMSIIFVNEDLLMLHQEKSMIEKVESTKHFIQIVCQYINSDKKSQPQIIIPNFYLKQIIKYQQQSCLKYTNNFQNSLQDLKNLYLFLQSKLSITYYEATDTSNTDRQDCVTAINEFQLPPTIKQLDEKRKKLTYEKNEVNNSAISIKNLNTQLLCQQLQQELQEITNQDDEMELKATQSLTLKQLDSIQKSNSEQQKELDDQQISPINDYLLNNDQGFEKYNSQEINDNNTPKEQPNIQYVDISNISTQNQSIIKSKKSKDNDIPNNEINQQQPPIKSNIKEKLVQQQFDELFINQLENQLQQLDNKKKCQDTSCQEQITNKQVQKHDNKQNNNGKE